MSEVGLVDKETQEKIDRVLNELIEENSTYGGFVEALIATDKLNDRERVIAAFVSGETICRLNLQKQIAELINTTTEE